MDEKKPRYGLSPFRIACIYAVIGGLWILFSDTILAWIAADPATFIRLSIYKGWAFILITAALLYWLVHRYVAEQQAILIAENESRQYNRALFERSPIGLALCRMDGSLVDVNEAYARMIGRTVEETLTLSYWDITPKQYTEQEQVQLDSIRRTGKFGPYEKEYIHKDGRLVPVTLQGLIIERRGEQLICASVEDITERKKGEDIIRTVNEELMAINRIVQACSSTLDQKEILNIAMDEALQITGLEGGTICKVTPEDTLVLAVHRKTSDATMQDLTTNTIKVGDCLCGECARDLKPLILRDRQAVLNYATREATRGEDIRFHAAFPIIVKNRCLGVLCVFTRTDNKPSDRSLALLETVTVQIALALENAQLYEETVHYAAVLEDRVRERTAELEAKIAEIERINKLFVDRELRMIELKERIKQLESRTGALS